MNTLTRFTAALASLWLVAASVAQQAPSTSDQEKQKEQAVQPEKATGRHGKPEPKKPHKPEKPEPDTASQQVITIDGRRITVRVELTRDMMPGPRHMRNDGMVATVKLSTDHPEGLPRNIKSVRLWLSNPKRQSWRPPLTVSRSYRHEPGVLRLVARSGPRWEVNSQATALVILMHGSMTYRISVPVTVQGAH
jgi:hypothetical protein